MILANHTGSGHYRYQTKILIHIRLIFKLKKYNNNTYIVKTKTNNLLFHISTVI